MRRFRFRLAGYERLLSHREEDARLRAAEAAAERRLAADLLGRLRHLASAACHEREERRATRPLPPREELLYLAYFDGMGHATRRQEDALARASDRQDGCQRALREAATRRRVVGLLRERRLVHHRREALRELTRILDEAGARRHGAAGPEEPSPAA